MSIDPKTPRYVANGNEKEAVVIDNDWNRIVLTITAGDGLSAFDAAGALARLLVSAEYPEPQPDDAKWLLDDSKS